MERKRATDFPRGLLDLFGYPGDDEKGAELFRKVDQNKMFEDFVTSAAWLKSRPECTGKIGVVGFCFGGTMANQLAVRLPDLAAAVSFYGRQPSAVDAAKIKAPLLLHYASLDTRVTGGGRLTRKRLRQITCPIPRTFMRASIMVSITTQRPDTTRLQPSWLGNGPLIFSISTLGLSDALLLGKT